MSEERLRVLVTNDDGIEAPGLWCQAEAWATVADVLVVAPAHEQSGAGTSFTYRRELEIREVEPRVAGVRAYCVDGTPSDCVTTGLRRLAEGRIGVVSAGVNTGANLGRGVLASGTLGAALQGHYRGLVSLAISLERGDERAAWETAGAVVRRLAMLAAAGRLPAEPLLNVNIPSVPLGELAGFMFTRMATSHYQRLIEEVDDAGRVRRRLVVDPAAADEGTDVWALLQRYVSITPLHHDLTHKAILPELQSQAAKIFGE
ncbi:MAG TPA: 5'/3'-nucleotidase SurE [Dehalococcoidia bacterium]|nr:5'/3'-nucleotidase SurE [Dehalococcoidia bacterium]